MLIKLRFEMFGLYTFNSPLTTTIIFMVVSVFFAVANYKNLNFVNIRVISTVLQS